MFSYLLIDTSAWIESFPSSGNPIVQTALADALTKNLAATCGIIRLELLQGAHDAEQYTTLQLDLDRVHNLPIKESLWEETSQLSFNLRRRGFTIPTTDVVIAAVAMHYHCALLHYDRHFDLIARHAPLKLFKR
ncbi:MAG: PIN domain nuclease [Candidatus Omnitrophica bacterium]|nr:PIN domain nuclease [Candidatus Omnitrophota bacterium]